MIILGAHSPKLDAVRELRTKRGRRERGRYLIEGPTLLAEALASGLEPIALYVTESGSALLPRGAGAGNDTFLVPDRAMARLSELETPPGILAVLPLPESDLEAMLAGGLPIAVLAGIGDPGNAGTILRTAEIFGFRGVVFSADAVEPYNPKVVRATMGAIFRLSIAVADARGLVEAAKRHGYTIVAAAGGGVPLAEFRFPGRSLIAIGHERRGVTLPGYDVAVGIPQPGRGESLNAAVASGIIFYTFSQQCERSNSKV